jgi:hypothetical protein
MSTVTFITDLHPEGRAYQRADLALPEDQANGCLLVLVGGKRDDLLDLALDGQACAAVGAGPAANIAAACRVACDESFSRGGPRRNLILVACADKDAQVLAALPELAREKGLVVKAVGLAAAPADSEELPPIHLLGSDPLSVGQVAEWLAADLTTDGPLVGEPGFLR